MTQELIYTSAPQGLKPGSRGFCTVVSTQGMAVNLAERLESLSAYRHVFAPQDANARLNPVVYSHLRIAVGGRLYHVLSRIAAAGLDYTQRTNKFAHHVVLDPSELASAGPAWLLSQPEFMQTEWDGNPKILAGGRRAIAGTTEPEICRHWQAVASDAGWAGVLAESAKGGTKSGATVIYQPGTDVLPLVAEAMSLLSAQRRWEISFSTYYTKLPPGTDCTWRFALLGSPEAQASSRIPGAIVIDLCRPLGRAVGGPLVEAARTGQIPVAEDKLDLVATEVDPSEHSLAVKGQARSTHLQVGIDVAPLAPLQLSEGDFASGPPPPPKPFALADRPAIPWQPQRKTPTRWPWIAAIGATIVILAVGIGTAFWWNTVIPKIDATLASNSAPTGEASPSRPLPKSQTANTTVAATTPPERKSYDDALSLLKTKPDLASQPKYKKLEPLQLDIVRIRKEMETSAQKNEFKHALQLCNDLGTKVDAYNAAHNDLENKKKAYEDALSVLNAKPDVASPSKYKTLEQKQQELSQVRTKMEGSAQLEEFDRALEQCRDLETRVKAYNGSLAELKSKKKTYEDAFAALKPRFAALVPMPPEIETAKRQMEEAARNEEYDQAVNYAKELTANSGLYNSIIPSVEVVQKKNPQEYLDRVTVCELSADTSQPISLRLIHPKLPKGLFYRLGPHHDSDDKITWDVSVGPQDTTPFGKFELSLSTLSFKWTGEAARQPSYRALRNCILQIEPPHTSTASNPHNTFLRRTLEIEPIIIGEFNGKPVTRHLHFDDVWPGVPIKLASIKCTAANSKLTKAGIVVIGNGAEMDGSVFFQLMLQDTSTTENEYARQYDVVFDYLGIGLPNRLPSGSTGQETNSEFHTHRILAPQIQEWINRIDGTIRQKQTQMGDVKKMQNEKPKGDKRDYEGEIADLTKAIDRLNEEKTLVNSTVSVNLTQAKGAIINFAICFDVDDDGRVREVPLAKTKTIHVR